MCIEETHYKWPCSIAMFVNQRVSYVDFTGNPPNEPTMVDSGIDITNQANTARFAANSGLDLLLPDLQGFSW